MYSLNMPVAKIRAKMREEFEKHRYVNNIKAVDVLIMQSHAEFQVRFRSLPLECGRSGGGMFCGCLYGCRTRPRPMEEDVPDHER